MDLASIVSSAFAAASAVGVAGSGTLSRTSVDSTAVDALTDAPGAPVVASVPVPSVVLDVPRRDRVLPPGLVLERTRIASLPAASLSGFVPKPDDVLTIAGVAWTVVEGAPLDPTGAAPAMYELLVRC